MKLSRLAQSFLVVPVLLSSVVFMGADGNGCGGDVTVGSDDCEVGGCSGELCGEPGDDLVSDCSIEAGEECYAAVGVCERNAEGVCGWTPTNELAECLADAENPPDCIVGGCSGQLCGEPGDELGSTCEWEEEYACYTEVGVCERDAEGACGWRDSEELAECIDEKRRDVVTGACVKTNDDTCAEDADCVAGGCGGELCFNPAQSEGVSDCECTAPAFSCGCVNGSCVWFE